MSRPAWVALFSSGLLPVILVLASFKTSFLPFPSAWVHSSPDSKVIYCQVLDLISMMRGGNLSTGTLWRLQEMPEKNRTFDYPDRLEEYTRLLALFGFFIGSSLMHLLLLQSLLYILGGFFLYRILLSWEFPSWLAAALTALFFLMPVSFSWRLNLSKETIRIPALLGFFWAWGLALKGEGSFWKSLTNAGAVWLFLLSILFVRRSEAGLLLALAGITTFLFLLLAWPRALLVSRGLCLFALLVAGALAFVASPPPSSRAEKILSRGFAEIWKPSDGWARVFDRPVYKICFSRYRFFSESGGAGLTVGPRPTAPSTGWFLDHARWFLAQGILPSLPIPWLEGRTTGLSIYQRLLVAGETWFSFGAILLAPAFLISRRGSEKVFIRVFALVCLAALFFFASAVPNSATLLRLRFPYAYLLAAMGLGWIFLRAWGSASPGSKFSLRKLQ